MTGAAGFLGWHVRCRARALDEVAIVPVDRSNPGDLAAAVESADAVVHLAGVNRGPDDVVAEGNLTLARRVADAVDGASHPVQLVYANSIQAGNGTPYGDAKASAGDVLAAAAHRTGGGFVDVRLPNLFGEHGRADYNSFVATFCRDVAQGSAPRVSDREVALLHAQQAAACLLTSADGGGESRVDEPLGHPTSVLAVLESLQAFDELYRRGDIPVLVSEFQTDLFNTYRSHLFPRCAPVPLTTRSDARGSLVECVRAHGGSGQTFISTTAPGVTRGEHFHLRKVERFVVVRGDARVSLRRMFSSEVVHFDVSGESVVALDMPTMWAHNITNIGTSELVTLFWTDSLFDPASPDTYAEPVHIARELQVVA